MEDVSVAPAVQEAARDHDLGLLVDARKLTNPLAAAAGYLALAVAAFAIATLIVKGVTAVEDHLPRSVETAVGFAGLFLIVFGCGFVIAAVIALARGSRSYFLWEGGFIYRHNGSVRAYPWAEIAEVVLRRYETGENVGKVYQYRVVPGRGRPIAIPVQLTDGQDAFNEALVEAVRKAGRPVA